MNPIRRRPSGGPSFERSHRRARDPGEDGRLPAPGTAHALFLRGREAEDAGDPEGALALYAEAAATRDAGSDPAELGALIHHMANCSLLLGDVESAWERYLAAARLFHRHGVKVDLGASLGEAGMLLVHSEPPEPEAVREDVTHALLLSGLAGAIDHAVDALLGEGSPSVAVATDVHRRLAGLMVLATSAAADHVLREGALAIRDRVARPLEKRYGVGPETSMGEAKAFSATFMGLARLWAVIWEQERQDRAGIPPTREEAEAVRTLAPPAFPHVTRPLMLPWIDAYLRDRRGAERATDDGLATAAGRA